MNRRKFLKWFGIGSAAVVVAPKVLLPAKGEVLPEVKEPSFWGEELDRKIKDRIIELEDRPKHRIFQFGWDDGWCRYGDVCLCEDGHEYFCSEQYKWDKLSAGKQRILVRVTNDPELRKIYQEKETKKWFCVKNNVHPYGDYPMTPDECYPSQSLMEEALRNPDTLEKIVNVLKFKP